MIYAFIFFQKEMKILKKFRPTFPLTQVVNRTRQVHNRKDIYFFRFSKMLVVSLNLRNNYENPVKCKRAWGKKKKKILTYISYFKIIPRIFSTPLVRIFSLTFND